MAADGTPAFAMCVDSLPRYREALARLNLDESSAEAAGAVAEVELSGLPSFPANFPAVKQIPATRFVVDGFRSAGSYCVAYFLSHFHSDHYTGITQLWNKGIIYCSEITASLVLQVLRVSPDLVVALPMGQTVCIDGVEVSLVDANHCPGAVQFLFRVPVVAAEEDDAVEDGLGSRFHRYVHTGDMRYASFMKEDASLVEFVGADAVFLDTTYCNPKFVFPNQLESVGYVADTVFSLMQGCEEDRGVDDDVVQELNGNGSIIVDGEGCDDAEGQAVETVRDSSDETGSTARGDGEPGQDDEDVFRVVRQGGMAATSKSILFLISTYVIGKEKILTAVSRKCNCLIYVNERKLSVLKCLKLEDMGIFTTDPTASNVHVVGWSFLGETWPYFRPNFGNMEKILAESGFSRVVGFVPTGWAYELRKKTFSVRRKGACEIHLVPYSEHSNYDELREYVGYLRPKEIIPTVGLEGGGVDGKAVAAMRKHFRNLVDETASKRKFLKCFKRRVVEDSEGFKQTQAAADFFGVQADAAVVSKENGDTKVGFVVPKAAFGRGARKKRREIDLLSTDVGKEQQEMATSMASQLSLVVKMKNSTKDGASPAVAQNESGAKKLTTSSSSEKLDLVQRTEGGNHLSPSVSTPREIEESLRSVLPSWVTEKQVERLVRKANGDVNAAVANFYEQETDLMDEVQGWAGGLASTSAVVVGGLPGAGALTEGDGLVGLSNCNEQLKQGSSEAFKLLRSSGTVAASTTGPLGKRLASVAASNVSTSKSRSRLTGKATKPAIVAPGKTGKNKAKTSVPATQPTILTFFKKAGNEVPSVAVNTNTLKSDSDATEAMGDPLDAIDSGSQARSDVDIEPGNVVNTFPTTVSADLEVVFTSQPARSQAGETDRVNINGARGPFKYNDEVSQLLLILDGIINKEEAEILLEKVHGNVGEALDLHYETNSAHEQAKLCACKSISIGCVIEATASHHEVEETSVAKGSDFSFVNKDLVNEDLEVSKPGPSGNFSDNLESLGVKSEERISVSNVSVGLDPNIGSVAFPVGQYNPIAHACWKVGELAPYVHLARAFDLVEHESGRLKTADMLCNMFRSLLALSPEDVLPAVYLATNRIAPDHESTDLNIGGSIVAAAISEATGTPRAKLREMYNNMGDLGDVAQACRQNQSMLRPPPALRICKVFATLHQISKESGNGSGGRKKGLVLGLVRACREKETKYIVRTLVQNMRIGAMMRTVLHALAHAVVLHKSLPSDCLTEKSHETLKSKLQEASVAVVEAYNFLPNLDLLIPKLINEGVEGLTASIAVQAGTPIKPMLAKITNGVPEVLKKFQGRAFTCEYKYDGQRAQVHLLPDGSVRIFSRNGEDNTSKFPDVAEIVRSAMEPGTEMFIIDAEVVAVDRENGNTLMAFQHLSTRERGSKDGNVVQNIKVEVCVFLFDIMLANNKSLVKCPLRERRKYMHTIFPNLKPGYFQYANEITVESDEAHPESASISQKLDDFLDEAFGASCEGLMAKLIDEDSTYMASKRSDSWLKVKRDYVEGLHDTLDLVPIGAWHGNGRKAGWYSPFLVACYDANNEEYQSVCRVMSGFSDAFYRESKEFYSDGRVLPKKPVYYQTREECDVWFSAEVVWEIRGADLTISPVHQAGVGLVHPSRGISMRFPRFISARTDKKTEDASSPSDIADLFHQQTRKLNVPGSGREQKGDSE